MATPMRTVHVEPPGRRLGVRDGLAYALFLPAGEPRGRRRDPPRRGLAARSSHFDFAPRAARPRASPRSCFDQRGHGESEGALDGRAIDDVATIARRCCRRRARRRCAARAWAAGWRSPRRRASAPRAVVAICPATRRAACARGLRDGRFDFRADAAALDALLAEHDDRRRGGRRSASALLLLHAEGDEVVPVEHSRALHAAAPGSRLVAVPGGHHRSVQHDPELQALAVRFLARRCAARAAAAAPSSPGPIMGAARREPRALRPPRGRLHDDPPRGPAHRRGDPRRARRRAQRRQRRRRHGLVRAAPTAASSRSSPRRVMIAQRPPDAAPAIIATAEALPLADDAVDAAMAVLTDHHWADRARGLAEMRRVARRRAVVFQHDPSVAGTVLARRATTCRPSCAASRQGRSPR